jgi:hypothetical protein
MLFAVSSAVCRNNSLFAFQNSLFRRIGNSDKTLEETRSFRLELGPRTAKLKQIPCIFPDDQEFGAETGSQQTASSATQSQDLKILRENARNLRIYAGFFARKGPGEDPELGALRAALAIDLRRQ